jgi:D-amino-acid dehydrogenase
VLQWLGKEDAPLLFRIRADMRQWLWGLQFLRECTPARTRHNIEQIVAWAPTAATRCSSCAATRA